MSDNEGDRFYYPTSCKNCGSSDLAMNLPDFSKNRPFLPHCSGRPKRPDAPTIIQSNHEQPNQNFKATKNDGGSSGQTGTVSAKPNSTSKSPVVFYPCIWGPSMVNHLNFLVKRGIIPSFIHKRVKVYWAKTKMAFDSPVRRKASLTCYLRRD